MRLHQIKPIHRRKKAKRIGRGGKRGTYSGHGMKGQKSRAGARIRPGFRGGDNPIWKLFPKQRGATKRVEAKHAKFRIIRAKPAVVSLSLLNARFKDGDKISAKTLIKKGIISSAKNGVKVLANGQVDKKLNLSGLKVSQSARTKITEAGGLVE